MFLPCDDIKPYDSIRNSVDPATIWLFPEHHFMPLIALPANHEAELVAAIQSYNAMVKLAGEPYPAAPVLMGFYLSVKSGRILAINDTCRDAAVSKYINYLMGVQLPRIITLLNNIINSNYTFDTNFVGTHQFMLEFPNNTASIVPNMGEIRYDLAGYVGSSSMVDGYYSSTKQTVGDSLTIPLVRADQFDGSFNFGSLTGGAPVPTTASNQPAYPIPVPELLLHYTGKYAGLIGGLGALPNVYDSLPIFDLLTKSWGNCSVATRLFFDSLPINTFGDTLTKFDTVHRMSNTAQVTGLYQVNDAGDVLEFTGDNARGKLTVARLAPLAGQNSVLSSVRLDCEGYNDVTLTVSSALDGNNLSQPLAFSKTNTVFTGRSAGLWHAVTVEGNFILRSMYVTYSSGGLR